jgi:hypothetical protein
MARAELQPVALLRVEVAYSPAPRRVDVVVVELPEGATVLHALRASRLLERHPEIDLSVQRVGVWGRAVGLAEPLRASDRVEVYRGLRVDPKEARRQRYRSHKQERVRQERVRR